MRIYPENLQTMLAFQQMMRTPNHRRPIVEMNETTARDLTVIWNSVIDASHSWRGTQDIHFPGMPMDRKDFWGAFAANQPLHLPLVGNFIKETSGQDKVAIDLGCGNSRAIPELLNKGWKVIAVDHSPIVLSILSNQYQTQIKSGRLEIIDADISDFIPSEPADLVIAADVLPYINPLQFRDTWNKIHQRCVKENGFFIGSVFRSIDNIPVMNSMAEMGAWFFPDRRMIRPLLQETGYEIEKCAFRKDSDDVPPIAIQFKAKKICA